MTGNSTKRMNEFAMRRTEERERENEKEEQRGRTGGEGKLGPLTIPIAAAMLCVASFVSEGNTKRGAGRGTASEGGRKGGTVARGGAVEILLPMLSLACAVRSTCSC